MHTRAAIATGTYGSHIETRDGTCDTTTSVSRPSATDQRRHAEREKRRRPTDVDDVAAEVNDRAR